jgi:lysozyme
MKLSLVDTLNETFISLLGLRSDGTKMTASQDFWDWIKWHEGSPKKKGEPVLVGYRDSVGVPTIGYGHTGPEVKIGMKIDKNQALKYLYADAKIAADCVRRILNEWKSKKLRGYKLKQNEFDALVSLVYNSGCSGVRKSQFIKKLQVGDYEGTAKNILQHKSAGLSNRRKAEYEMFKNKNYLMA